MDDLILKIRADAKGVRPEIKGIADETDGLELSSRKASTAMRGFVQDLSQARNASDVASAALGAFSKILGTTLAGTAVVMAGKVIIDSFQKVSENVNKAKDSLASAREEISKMGAVTGLEQGTAQANLLYKAASDAEKAIKEIEKSKLQNFIAEVRGAKDELSAMAVEAKRSADTLKLRGIQAEAGALAIQFALTEEDKAVRKVTERYAPLIKAARELNDVQLLRGLEISQQKDAVDALAKYRAEKDAKAKEESLKIAKELADEAYKLIDAEFNEKYKNNKILADQSLKGQEELKKIEDERIKAKEKAGQEEEKLTNRLIDLQEKQLTAQERVNKAREALIEAEGRVANIMATATGTGRGAQARPSSFEVGVERASQRAFEQTRRANIQAERRQIAMDLAMAGEAFDANAVNRVIAERAKEAARQRAREPFTAQKEAQKSLSSAESYLQQIQTLLETNFEELKKYAFVT